MRATTCAAALLSLLFVAACGDEAPVQSPSGAGGGAAAPCPAALTECGGRCVDLDRDRDNCGDCGAVCASGELCDGAGQCALSCQEALTDCAGVCVDTAVDNANCGGCGIACEAGEICNGSGDCAPNCQVGFVACDGVCTDPLTDEDHCGAGPDCAADPGAVCAPGELCDGTGTCAPSCPSLQVVCDGVCVNPFTDEKHCGAGLDCIADPGVACPPGQLCDGTGNCDAWCQPDFIECGGGCIDPLTNNQHCGAGPDCTINPGIPCFPGTVCNGSGQCTASCPPGFVDCFGMCVDPLTNLQFCGAGPSCSPMGTSCPGGHVCNNGLCELSCPSGYEVCGGTCVDPLTNNQHCGAGPGCMPTGTICPAGHVCNGSGLCELSCQSSHVDCGGLCVDPLTNESHCGAGSDCTTDPGLACPPSHLCSGGQCQLDCPSGFVPCIGTCIDPSVSTCPCSNPGELLCNSSCVDPLTDPLHCGAIGDCTGPYAGSTCGPGEICDGGSCCQDCGGNGCCGAGQLCSAGLCIQPLVNGSFESGFTGWLTQDLSMPLIPLSVGSMEPGPFFFPFVPTDGALAVGHGFDGNAGEIRVMQDVTLGSGPSVTLQFDYRAGWDNFGTLPRTFEVRIEPYGGGPPLQTFTILTAQNGTTNFDTGPLTGQVNLSAFAGQQVRLAFVWVIPETFTGPGSFLFDNVQIF